MYRAPSLELRLTFGGGGGGGGVGERKESLVHTVCACVKIPRNPGNSYFVRLSVRKRES